MTPIHSDEERARQVAAIKRSRTIPYGDIAIAIRVGTERFPDAHRITGKLYGGAPYIEVWDGAGAAKIYFVDVDAEQVLDQGQAPMPPKRLRASRSKAKRPSAT